MVTDYVVDPAALQPNEETSGAFPFTERTFPSAFLELMTAGIHILRPLRTLMSIWVLVLVGQRSNMRAS